MKKNKINTHKMKTMTIGELKICIRIGGDTIEQVNQVKYLVTLLDDTVKLEMEKCYG